MSNHSHLHKNEQGQEIDAFGLRSECDQCRKDAGLPSMAEVEKTRQGVTTMQGSGRAPDDELVEDLDRAEKEIVELRAQLRDAGGAAARARDEAVERANGLQRQVTALERQVEQLPVLEGQLATSRARIAELEALVPKKK